MHAVRPHSLVLHAPVVAGFVALACRQSASAAVDVAPVASTRRQSTTRAVVGTGCPTRAQGSEHGPQGPAT